MFRFPMPEERVPADHPLRRIRQVQSASLTRRSRYQTGDRGGVNEEFMLFSEWNQGPANNGEFALIEKYSASVSTNLAR
jgi:hypothetical protein